MNSVKPTHRIYVVSAHLGGNPDSHTYLVGIYSDAATACENAVAEERWTMCKYSCTVQQRDLDQISESLIWMRENRSPQFDEDTRLLLESISTNI